MSAHIRAAIDLQKTVIRQQLGKIPSFSMPVFNDDDSINDRIQSLDLLEKSVFDFHNRLTKAVTAMEKWHNRWLNFIEGLEDQTAIDAETGTYLNNAQGTNGFLALLQEAENELSTLDVIREEIRLKRYQNAGIPRKMGLCPY